MPDSVLSRFLGHPPDGATTPDTPDETSYRLAARTLAALAIGLLFILLFCMAAAPSGQSFLSRIGASLALALSAAVLGVLLGFIFGIPRTLQQNVSELPADERERVGYQINTNLEQISDWLTKIIIGVGLVELGSIGSWLIEFSGNMATGFGNGTTGQAFVLGVLVYFSCAGFLIGYLWTRLTFGLAIKEADKILVERRIDKIEADVRADHKAMLLVARQLNATREDAGVTQKDLNAALASATDVTRVKIFYEAVAARRDASRRENAMAVFNALIEQDTGQRYYRNHAELGYALKDKADPDWASAFASFSDAIEIRDRVGDSGFGDFEFSRALCRIHLGHAEEDVVADFKKAAEDEWIRGWTIRDPAAQAWLEENGIDWVGLGFEPKT
ncbi:MAG: hypothetical protein GY798_25345 [Hyphomicrobiales bacterium]|nr:hypothetical protein [Hyphomicrobiales bacterium]